MIYEICKKSLRFIFALRIYDLCKKSLRSIFALRIYEICKKSLRSIFALRIYAGKVGFLTGHAVFFMIYS